MQIFDGKLAVITGGASGVGRSLAAALGELGARVLIADLDEPALQATSDGLRARGIEAHSQRCDVSSAEQLEALARKASRPGRADRNRRTQGREVLDSADECRQ